MSNCLLIILVIGSSVIFGGLPSRFLKCCSHSFTLSCWLAAFNFALAVLFLLLTSFIVCQAGQSNGENRNVTFMLFIFLLFSSSFDLRLSSEEKVFVKKKEPF